MALRGALQVLLLIFLNLVLVALAVRSDPSECPANNRCSIHCFFHGDCQGDGSCKCHEGWTGVNCTEPTCDFCGRHGTCVNNNQNCKCSVGYAGSDCSKFVAVAPWRNPTCDPFGFCICNADGAQCPPGYGPDLVPVKTSIRPFIEHRQLDKCHCAVDEGCALEGIRKLLRFTMETGNQGNADLFIGNSADYTDRYIWHQCHNHPHYVHWTEFILRPKFSSQNNNTRIGFKSGSSIIDSRRVNRVTGADRHKYTDKQQGLQIGWSDWYPYWLDCQWIDVTGLELGPYELEVWANPDGIIFETNYDNNKVVIDIECNPACVHGKCDFGHGCVCDENWTGRACDTPSSSG